MQVQAQVSQTHLTVSAGTVYCNQCGVQLQSSFKFCPGCGEAVQVPCAATGEFYSRFRIQPHLKYKDSAYRGLLTRLRNLHHWFDGADRIHAQVCKIVTHHSDLMIDVSSRVRSFKSKLKTKMTPFELQYETQSFINEVDRILEARIKEIATPRLVEIFYDKDETFRKFIDFPQKLAAVANHDLSQIPKVLKSLPNITRTAMSEPAKDFLMKETGYR